MSNQRRVYLYQESRLQAASARSMQAVVAPSVTGRERLNSCDEVDACKRGVASSLVSAVLLHTVKYKGRVQSQPEAL